MSHLKFIIFAIYSTVITLGRRRPQHTDIISKLCCLSPKTGFLIVKTMIVQQHKYDRQLLYYCDQKRHFRPIVMQFCLKIVFRVAAYQAGVIIYKFATVGQQSSRLCLVFSHTRKPGFLSLRGPKDLGVLKVNQYSDFVTCASCV